MRELHPEIILDYGDVNEHYSALADKMQAAIGAPYLLLSGKLEVAPGSSAALAKRLGGQNAARLFPVPWGLPWQSCRRSKICRKPHGYRFIARTVLTIEEVGKLASGRDSGQCHSRRARWAAAPGFPSRHAFCPIPAPLMARWSGRRRSIAS